MIPQFLTDFARELEEKQRAHRLAERSGLWRPMMTPATDMGYHCDRRIVLHRTQPEMARPISEELASIFTEGKMHEVNVRTELAVLGFEIVETELNFRDEDLEISGTIDGKLEVAVPDDYLARFDLRHGKIRIPTEIKCVTPDPPRTSDDWQNHSLALFRRYFTQLQSYMILTSSPFGMGLFKAKITGLWTVVPVELDYRGGEQLMQRAERVRDAVAAVKKEGESALPKRMPGRQECPTCPYRDTVCHPADEEIDPMLLIEDTDLLVQLKRRHEIDPLRKEYKSLDEEIRTRFKLTAGSLWVVGDVDDGFSITRKITKSGSHRFTFTRLEAAEETA